MCYIRSAADTIKATGTADVAHHASHSSSAQDPTDTLLQQGSSRGAGSSMQQQHQGVGKVRAPPTDKCMHKMYACGTAARPAAIELKYHVCWTPVATTCVCLCVCVSFTEFVVPPWSSLCLLVFHMCCLAFLVIFFVFSSWWFVAAQPPNQTPTGCVCLA
jgi:hypothetical protein